MTMPSFPSVKAPDYSKYQEGIRLPARRTEFEGNTISTRPRAAKARKLFTVGWSRMSNADKESVFTFFETYQGLAFSFTPPGEATATTCVFADDEIRAVAVGPDAVGRARWSLSINLYECLDSVILANAAEEVEA